VSVPLDVVVAFLDGTLETHTFDDEASTGLVLRSSETVSRVACAMHTSFHAIAREVRGLRSPDRPPPHLAADRSRPGAADARSVDGQRDLPVRRALGARRRRRVRQSRPPRGCARRDGPRAIPAVPRRDGRHRRATRSHVPPALRADARRARRAGGRVGERADLRPLAIATGGAGLTTMLGRRAPARRGHLHDRRGQHVHQAHARERGINLIFGSQWATETLGVKALASQLEERSGLPWVCIAEQDDIR